MLQMTIGLEYLTMSWGSSAKTTCTLYGDVKDSALLTLAYKCDCQLYSSRCVQLEVLSDVLVEMLDTIWPLM